MIAERVYCVTHHRSLNPLSLAAGERYEQLVFSNPVLIEKISGYQLAAYLGITPQSLSRIKKER